MKRSSQVLLVVMGVTSTTAVGQYLTTPQSECVQQAPAAKPGNPELQQVTQQPCRNTSSNRTGSRSWWGSSDNSGSSSSEHSKTASSTSAPGATRGGFGGTGHGFSSGS
jgi:hypothetical protein